MPNGTAVPFGAIITRFWVKSYIFTFIFIQKFVSFVKWLGMPRFPAMTIRRNY